MGTFFLPILDDLVSLGPQDVKVMGAWLLQPIQAPKHQHKLVLMKVFAEGQAHVKLMVRGCTKRWHGVKQVSQLGPCSERKDTVGVAVTLCTACLPVLHVVIAKWAT
jgi:hypothetical protein